jgi:hypothetical protein
MKTLLYDLETSPLISYTWGIYEQNVIKIKEQAHILSFAYKWLGDKSVKAYSLPDFKGDKKKLVEKLHELFDEADVIIAHNGNHFDNKVANREFVRFNLTPPSPYKTIDTLSVARSKFKFQSNHLNDLGEFLGVGKKVETGGFGLWLACMNNEEWAWKKMVKYNKQDVALLEAVYLKLRPYMANHPELVSSPKKICPMCGSDKLHSRGWSFTTAFMKKRYRCQGCGKWLLGESVRYKDKVNVLK